MPDEPMTAPDPITAEMRAFDEILDEFRDHVRHGSNIIGDKLERALREAFAEQVAALRALATPPAPAPAGEADLVARLRYVLEHFVETEDGTFTFPDGQAWDAKKRASGGAALPECIRAVAAAALAYEEAADAQIRSNELGRGPLFLAAREAERRYTQALRHLAYGGPAWDAASAWFRALGRS